MVENKTTMQAVQIVGEFGIENLKVVEMPMPTPKSGQVLIRVDASPINPSDVAYVKGSYPRERDLPIVPGFEGSGTIISSGGGFLGWSLVGKNVAFTTSKTLDGAWAEYVVTEAKSCVKIGNNPLESASCSFVNPLTVLSMMDIAKTKSHKAIIHTAAASSLGKMLIREANESHLPLINIVRREAQVEDLKTLGAEYVLNQNDEDFEQKLQELSAKLGATCCFEAVAGDLTGQIMNAMPHGSVVYCYGGLSSEPVKGIAVLGLIAQKKRLEGLWLPEYLKTKSMWAMLGMVSAVQKKLLGSLSTTIAKRYELGDIQEAFKFYLENMSAGKTLLRPNGLASEQK